VSEGHPFRNSPNKGTTDIGGNFFTQKKYIDIGDKVKIVSQMDEPNNGRYLQNTYSGHILAVDPSIDRFNASSFISSNSNLDALGTTAISHVKPTNPVGGLTTALLELRRDGLPHLLGSSLWEGKVSILRSAGDEYLNKEFGWDPLANDVADFLNTITHARDVIQRYKQGIGKPTRRRFDFTPIRQESETYLGAAWPFTGMSTPYLIHPNAPPSAPGGLFLQSEVTVKRWFSGAFTYYFPRDADDKLRDISILAHELGLELTPDTIWAATPWSWAVDWISNLGDIVSNYSSFHNDGLVMTYGYMMEHSIVKNTYRLVNAIDRYGGRLPVSDVSYVTETKQRRGATPYGFGLSFGSFSNFQKSIIGALGITKLFR
jgi:hypothetical protein